MFKNVKVMRRLTALLLASVFLFGFASCSQNDDDDGSAPVSKYLTAVNGVPADFVATWENNDWGWHSEYKVESKKISDVSMNVIYNVVSKASFVEPAYGYTVVFCQVAEGSGTDSTPAGNFYAVALKLTDGKLSICCPLDYALQFTTLEALKANYTASSDIQIGTANWVTECTKM